MCYGIAQTRKLKIMNQELCETLNEKLKQIRTLQIRIGELEAKNEDLFQDKRSYIKYARELEREIDSLLIKIDELELDKVETKIRNEVDREGIKLYKPQKLMHYEDRNILSYEIVGTLLRNINYEIRNEKSLEFLYDKVEQLLEPYTTGTYKNYN